MIRFVRPSRLRELGILGMNNRNVGFIGSSNKRSLYPLVDDKLKTKRAALDHEIAVPELYGTIDHQFEVSRMVAALDAHERFVIKPAQGSGGRGILVIVDRKGPLYVKPSGVTIDASEVRRHASNILAGLYSLGGRNDQGMIEALIDFDDYLRVYSHEGVPDIRVVVFRGVPVMAMVRCATHDSDGKANLHQGAVGVGIDMASGRAVRAVQNGELVTTHPDTGAKFDQLAIPEWDTILDLASRCAEMTGLGYLGADIVLDRVRGPMMLELNARPGLAIQVANQEGLLHRLRVAAEIADSTDDHATRISLAQERFGRKPV